MKYILYIRKHPQASISSQPTARHLLQELREMNPDSDVDLEAVEDDNHSPLIHKDAIVDTSIALIIVFCASTAIVMFILGYLVSFL